MPLLLLTLLGCQSVQRFAVALFDEPYEALPTGGGLQPTYDGPDAELPRIAVDLAPVAEGLTNPTDLAFHDDLLLVAEKGGTLWWVDGDDRGVVLERDVLTVSEQGLLGFALHPDFDDNGLLYVNVVEAGDDGDVTRIVAYRSDDLRAGAEPIGVLLEVAQPYQNHNAGQLRFGPDGMLYVGLGDGGFRYDPLGAGQDPSTLLGKMLRLAVDGAEATVPPDNPFVDDPRYRPEIWALGLRNPWRYAFDPDGRLIVADVGQDRREEVSVVTRGANLGWNVREADLCFRPEEGCATEGLVDPVWSYGRDRGQSITGGVVATGDVLPELRRRYLVGDFVSGRLWALAIPDEGPVTDVASLGRWPILPSAFAVDERGEPHVADFGGTIWRIVPATDEAP